MAMRVFCALTFHKIYDRLTHHLRVDTTLEGKNIIIIGGSSGIGRAVAELCLELGANITLTSRDRAMAEKVALEIGKPTIGLGLDINSEEEVLDFFGSSKEIDHVYIAAGATKLGPLTGGTLGENMQAFNTRIMGSLHVVKAAVDKMKPFGSVTFTGGISTDRPIAGAWVSGLATSTAEQLARVLVMEFPHIRFNAVSPGYTDTPMWDTVLGNEKTSILANVAEKLPVKKIATPAEVASAVVFLMSNGSVTGEVIHVDGGGRLV